MEEFKQYIDNYFKMDVSCSNFCKLNYDQSMFLNGYDYIQSFMDFYNIISEKLPEIPLEISLILSEKNETMYKSLKKLLNNSVFSNSNKKVDNTPLDIIYNDNFENNNMYDDTDTEDTKDTITKKEVKQVNLGLKTGRRKTIKNNEIIIGIYTASQRKKKIKRYREKRERAKLRGNKKVIIYKCRKVFADNRPRVGGRFVPMKK
jgi:uncharacterized protein Veg